MTSRPKERLDTLVFERGLSASREQAKALIMSGNVYVNGQKAEKAGMSVPEDAELEVREGLPFVSRGGLKLERALEYFGIDVNGRKVLDCGASTGGFTDCLLKRGAARVWAIDVGFGQLAWALRNDERVVCMERFNVRKITREIIGEPVDLAVCDLSFISLKLVLPALLETLEFSCELICLVKPQFEAGREFVGKNGVVRDYETHIGVLESFEAGVKENGMALRALTHSPVKGPKGNIEFLAHLVRPESGNAYIGSVDIGSVDIGSVVAGAHSELTENTAGKGRL